VVALNPFMVYFSGLVLSETLFTALLAWGVALLAMRRNVLWGGAVLAVSVLVRPSAVGLPLVLGVGAMFLHPGDAYARRPSPLRMPVAATMLLLTVAALLPWAVRNRVVLGEWVWLTTNGGAAMYDGFHAGATGASDQSGLTSPEMAPLAGRTELERDAYLSAEARGWIGRTWAREPWRLVRLTVAKIGRTWSPAPLSDEHARPAYVAAGLGYAIPLFVLVVVGVWRGRLPRAAKIFLLLPAAYFTLVHAASVGSLRYRVPVEPPMTVVAAAALVLLARPLWRRRVQPQEPEPQEPEPDAPA